MTPNGPPPPTATATEPTASAQVEPRAKYSAPKLRHLGSVRELTLGATGFLADGGSTRMR